ncbi:helix-turn-helix domain-containing protein [Nocardia huaxiensis]|uniref:helix-turn-helix domain-containing protein n=1 Tax=Nocardia huaxiensis TaxID=2755382 RepID=UPI001E308067|nr:helix-turn-helix transcriptional regulator [Nocardia huaxiensis]UFS93746.1 helix-turn-helix domain-containing protein [Nocardia huaxiensis]
MSGSEAPSQIGQRVRLYRERAGMARPILAAQIGRSAEWLKALENGRIQRAPSLDLLLRIARVLDLDDLATLTGDDHAVPVTVFAGERHAALSEVQAALTDYRITPSDRPVSVGHLDERLRKAWRIRHSSPDHRSQLGALLPGLIRDAQTAARTAGDRRAARRTLAGVYQLADFYVAYQPAPELVWMVADRAVNEGYEADDPYVIACSAWAMVQALRDFGRWEEAIMLARNAIDQLNPYLDRAETPDDWLGIAGALEFEIAYVHGRRGRSGDAWHGLEQADLIAQQLGPTYRHVQSSFSQPVMAAHATTLGVELRQPGEALRAAHSIDADHIVSVPRRGRHLIEVARAYMQRDEDTAALTMLVKSEQTAPETIRYNGFARDMLRDLLKKPPTGMRNDVRELCQRMGVRA